MTEDIVAVNFLGRTVATSFPATGVLAIVAECAAVTMNLVVEAENFAVIAVAMKW